MWIAQFVVALAACLAACLPCAARPVVTLRSDLWCPYNCTPGSDHPGYAVEIAQIVFGEAGYDVDYQLLNWARSIQDVRQGRADAVIGAYQTDVPGFIIPREPIGYSSAGFAVRRGDPFVYADPRSLDGRVLGIVTSYEFAGALGAYLHALRGDKSRLQQMSGDGALAKNLLKLLAGHIDVVIDDADVIARTVNELQLGESVSVSRGRRGAPLYIAFSPAGRLSALYADILADGVARLRASGRLAVILARYGMTDWR